MLTNRRNLIVVAIEAILMLFVAVCLWYRFLLPTSYFVTIVLLTISLTIQIVKSHDTRFLVFQIALLFLLTRNTYYLATNYSIIPFNDGNLDYGVVRTFMDSGSIYVIRQTSSATALLTWYSGWPVLHTLAMSLSYVSGIDAFHVALLLPSIMSVVSFVFVYFFVEQTRKSLEIDARITPLALLIYVASAESFLWPMQFVRQNLGILFFTILIYLISSAVLKPHDVKYKALTVFFAMSLVLVHHFTSLVMAVFLLLIVLLPAIGKYRVKTAGANLSTTGIALLMFSLLFVWWDSFGSIIWPTVGSGISRFIGVLLGTREIVFLPVAASYPSIMRHPWILSLLTIRDLLIYVPASFGLLLVAIKARKTPTRSLVIYSALAFGIVFIIDNLFLRVETFRIPSLFLPFIVLLSAISYIHLRKSLKPFLSSVILATVVAVLLLSLFVGFWGHSFAPVHIYDSHIANTDVGERNTDFMRVSNFLTSRLSTNRFQRIWTDDPNPLIALLDSKDYDKIENLDLNSIEALNPHGNDLVCAFKDLNLYSYYRGTFSESQQQTEVFRNKLYKYLQERFNQIYDDGKYGFWGSTP